MRCIDVKSEASGAATTFGPTPFPLKNPPLPLARASIRACPHPQGEGKGAGVGPMVRRKEMGLP